MWYFMYLLACVIAIDYLAGASLVWITANYALAGNVGFMDVCAHLWPLDLGVGLLVIVPGIVAFVTADSRYIGTVLHELIDKACEGHLGKLKIYYNYVSKQEKELIVAANNTLKEYKAVFDGLKNIGDAKALEQVVHSLSSGMVETFQEQGTKSIQAFSSKVEAELDAAMKAKLGSIKAKWTDQAFALQWNHLPWHDEFDSFTEKDKACYFDMIRTGNVMKFRRQYARQKGRKI